MKVSALGLIVCGPGGRMGGVLVRLIPETAGVALTGAVDRPGSPRLGQDAGTVAGAGHLGVEIVDRIEAAPARRHVTVDFTAPEASVANMKAAAESVTPIVIGITGFNASEVVPENRTGG